MRTVHETEALRPSDPIPKSMHGTTAGKQSKLKIIIKTPSQLAAAAAGRAESPSSDDPDHPSHATNPSQQGGQLPPAFDADGNPDPNHELYTPLPHDLFDAQELSWSSDKLYRKCFWEHRWASEILSGLERECRHWEEAYYREWLEKEALLSQVIKSEVDWHERREAILSGVADVHISGAASAAAGPDAGAGKDAGEPARERSSSHHAAVPINTIENGLRPTS